MVAVLSSAITAALTVWITYQISLARVKATYLPPSNTAPVVPDERAIEAAARLNRLKSTCLCGHMRSSHYHECLRSGCFCRKFESQADVTV